MKHKILLTFLVLCALLLAVAGSVGAQAPSILYVDVDATGANDGTSWTDAYIELQSALDDAAPSDEIWVAQGTYLPDYDVGSHTHTGDRTATFQLENGVALYGGFAGHETSRDQRDWENHITTLSGDLNGDDDGFTNNADNSYHVVTGSGTDTTAVLDGFTITGGNANGTDPDYNGGGMYNEYGSPTLVNVTFSGNSAYGGGGMLNAYGSPTLTDVTFSGNSADHSGGGMYNHSDSATLTNVTFSGNSASTGGGMCNEYGSATLVNVTFSGNSASNCGGMCNWDSSATLVNVTFSGNSAYYGGGMCNLFGSATLTNSILWGNTARFGPQIYSESSSPSVSYSLVQGGYTGTGNISDDPQFVDADGPDDMVGTLDDDLRLQATSPAIDAGDNSALPADTLDLDGDGDTAEPLPFDLDGNPRIVNGTVDMGAYEYQNNPPTAVDDAYSTDEDTVLSVAAPGVLDNDSDPDDDPLAVASFSQPAHGTLTLNDDGSFTYTPDADFNGTDGFTYKANDGSLDSNEAAVTITVNSVNDAPVVSADQSIVTADEGQTATNSGAVSDVDGDTVTLSASVGTVANNGDGTWSWEFATRDGPAESQTVTISADDGHGGESQTTFTLTVNNVAPSVGPINAPTEPVVVGTVVNASAPFSDPGLLDTHTAVWDWGDDASTPGTLTQGGGWVEDSHTYLSAGEYTIRLTVTDKDGGEGSATHPLTVQSPSEAIDSVVDEVEGLADLPDGTQNALISKLNNALDDLARGQDKGAVGKLNAFINSVEAQRGKKISEADADALIQTVQEIINAINAGLL